MGYGVVKYKVMVDQGQQNTDQKKTERGPVVVTLSNGQTYAWGPNQSITLPEPFCDEVVSADNRLKLISRS